MGRRPAAVKVCQWVKTDEASDIVSGIGVLNLVQETSLLSFYWPLGKIERERRGEGGLEKVCATYSPQVHLSARNINTMQWCSGNPPAEYSVRISPERLVILRAISCRFLKKKVSCRRAFPAPSIFLIVSILES
jgi:hypothetical protein